jgi:hypothetical protein
MTKLSRRDGIGLLALSLLLLLPATARAQLPPIAEQTAKAYGLDAFGQVEGIRFTFNAELPNVKVARIWEWHPKTDTVSYEGKDKEGTPVKATYPRAQLANQSDAVKNDIDPSFINDSYWLLLPLHLVWDGGATVTTDGTQKLPLGNGSAEHIVMKYPSEGGYAPGDTWEFFVGPDKRVMEIVYRRGGPKKPAIVMASFADNKKAGPLLISTDHHGTADGNPVRVFLTDVAVKVAGSDNWIKAQ